MYILIWKSKSHTNIKSMINMHLKKDLLFSICLFCHISSTKTGNWFDFLHPLWICIKSFLNKLRIFWEFDNFYTLQSLPSMIVCGCFIYSSSFSLLHPSYSHISRKKNRQNSKGLGTVFFIKSTKGYCN